MKRIFESVLFVFILNVIFSSGLFALDKAIVESVTDGDILKVIYKNNEERFRLAGIDTPETKMTDAVRANAEKYEKTVSDILLMGKRAMEYTKSLVKPNDKISIEFDVQFLDKDGKYLGYVYLEDGRMLNEELVREGFASPSSSRLNVKYKKRFLQAFTEARKNKKGLWSPAEDSK